MTKQAWQMQAARCESPQNTIIFFWADDDSAAYGAAKFNDPQTGIVHWHFLNAKGEVTGIAPAGTRWVERVYDGLAAFKTENGDMGYLKLDGSIAIKPVYAEAKSFRLGLAFVTHPDGRHSIINKQGEPLYDFAHALVEFEYFLNYAAFSEDGENYGLIGRSGKVILPVNEWFSGYFQTAELLPGLIYVGHKNVKKGLIREDGTMVFQPMYDVIQYLESGDSNYAGPEFELQHDGETTYADWDGHPVPAPKSPLLPGKYAVVTEDGRALTPAKYDEQPRVYGNYALCREDGQLVLLKLL